MQCPQHQDAVPASALQHAWQQMQAQQQQQQQQQPAARRSSLSMAALDASAAGAGAGAGKRALLSQQQLSSLVQQQLGYSLAVQPSRIKHHDAGMGLFVQGQVPPGALVALFPGLVYDREVYRCVGCRRNVGEPLSHRLQGALQWCVLHCAPTLSHPVRLHGGLRACACVRACLPACHEQSHRRMPNYPRIDKGNPYLTSLPWGRGWLADGSQVHCVHV
jgi:hypothetical protein